MDEAIGKLSVFFDDPFWVGIFEIIENDQLSAAARELIAPYCQGSTAFVGVRA